MPFLPLFPQIFHLECAGPAVGSSPPAITWFLVLQRLHRQLLLQKPQACPLRMHSSYPGLKPTHPSCQNSEISTGRCVFSTGEAVPGSDQRGCHKLVDHSLLLPLLPPPNRKHFPWQELGYKLLALLLHAWLEKCLSIFFNFFFKSLFLWLFRSCKSNPSRCGRVRLGGEML